MKLTLETPPFNPFTQLSCHRHVLSKVLEARLLSTNRNFGVFEHWSLNVGNLVRSWTLASRHVTELTEVLKQENKYSNRVFQSKLSE